jgi:hypothetical protein
MLVASPFMKKKLKLEKEKGFCSRTARFLFIKLHDAFIQAIPSQDVRDMPPFFMYSFGILIFLVLLVLFLTIFILSYNNAMDTQFLSPLYSSSTASPYCQTIPITNSVVLKATQLGYWEGNSGFEYSEASYIASVTNWQISPDYYANVMLILYEAIVMAGNATKTGNLGDNLLYWFSFTARPNTENYAQRFNLIGDPLVVFNREEVSGTISSVWGDCNETSVASFDPAKGILNMGFSYPSFLANPICNQTGNPYYLGYRPGINTNLYQMKIDVRSLVTALSVNIKISYLSDLVEIAAYRGSYLYQGVMYNISRYYDPHFPGMTPITCLTSGDIDQCCLTFGASTYALPIFNHLGNSTQYPVQCNCSQISTEELAQPDSNCNLFRFLAGFLYYPTDAPDGVLELLFKYNTSSDLINYYAFQASFLGSYWGINSMYHTNLFQNITFRESMYSFCNVSVGSCSIVTFSLFDELYDWSISSYYFQLLTGACQDKISTSFENW